MPVNERRRQDLHGRWGELILFGGAAGAIAAPLKLLVHHAFKWTHLAKPFYTELNAYLIHGHHRTMGLAEFIFGELGDMAIGAMFGILVSFVLRGSRPRYHWWLGAAFGFGIWFSTLAFSNLTKIVKPEMTDPWSLFAHLLAMLAFGLLIVLASRIWPAYRERLELRG
ncbi:MAG: hypothetical protein ACM3XS_06215 [Bacteroidota bacterium]